MSAAERLAAAQRDPELVAAAGQLMAGSLDQAERSLKAVLRQRPTEIAAIRMLAEVAGRIGRYSDAERLLARALELAPDFHAARANYVTVLHRQSKFAQALEEANRLIAAEPHELGHLAVKAAVLVRTGEYAGALDAYDRVLEAFPDNAPIWISRGHVLKTIGRQPESVSAYRRATELIPTLGDAWWSLANLKTVTFSDEDLAAMQAALASAERPEDRYHLHFAIAKALEERKDFATAFDHYAKGNALRRRELPYRAQRTTDHVAASKRLLTREFFEQAGSGGAPDSDPIFIVGLPRAGSTLIEQILASHSEVEGTMELPDIGTIAAELGGRGSSASEEEIEEGYLPRLLALTQDERLALGRRYLEGTRIQRKTSRPRFVDKMPNNFLHIGLIHLILPNATIIDARRHPMANGFSAFKQHFSRGQGFTYDLRDIGHYWRDYADLMSHYDHALPGRVLQVRHERLLADPEAEIRRILKHAGLPFEQACLTPHRNTRPVRTASSEQVRRPIAPKPDESWRNFSPWLEPLREALGGADESY